MSLLLDDPIFIIGCHKSGTSLLRSLLDGHSELFCLPKELHFFQAAGFHLDYPLRDSFDSRGSRPFNKDTILKFLSKENSSVSKYADSVGPIFDLDRFHRSFDQPGKDVEIREIYQHFLGAWLYSLGLNFDEYSGMRMVEKSVENIGFVGSLKSMFPRAKFLHIVRNPYATVCAIRRMKAEYGYPDLSPVVQAIRQSLVAGIKYRDQASQHKIIKYEDLTSTPRLVVNDIADFLRLPFESRLLHPTQLGKDWKGNSTYDQEFSRISSSSSERWRNEIRAVERWVVNRSIEESLMNEYGYSIEGQDFPIARERDETMRQYVKNRLFIR